MITKRKRKNASIEQHAYQVRNGTVLASCGIPFFTLCKPFNTRNIPFYMHPKTKKENSKKVYVRLRRMPKEEKKKHIEKKMETKKARAQGAGCFPREQSCCLLVGSVLQYVHCHTGALMTRASGPSFTLYNLVFQNHQRSLNSRFLISHAVSCVTCTEIRQNILFHVYSLY